MSNSKVELSNETLQRALEAANKEYPDKKDAFGKNQAFYLGVCHEAERSQKLDREIETLKAENSKMRQALEVHDEYAILLTDELNKILAYIPYGWKSARFDKGVELRDKIEALKTP